MTDSSARSGADRRTLPAPLVVDPTADAPLPSVAAAAVAGAGPVVLLLAAEPDSPWAAEAAVALARAVARQGRRVVLADLELERPRLHERLGLPNLEGVADVFLYGASLSRSAHPVPEQGFYFMAAGTYTPDPTAVLTHPRWAKIAAGFEDAEASLLLYLPLERAGAAALAEAAGAGAVVLGDPATAADPLPSGLPVHAVLLPQPPAAPAAIEEERVDEEAFAPAPAAAAVVAGDGAAVEPMPVDGDAVTEETTSEAAPVVHEPPVAEEPPHDAELRMPPPPVRAPRRRRGPAVLLWVLLVALLIGAAGYLLATTRPELVPWIGRVAGPVELEPAAVEEPRPAPVPVGDSLPFSVQVVAYDSPEPAARRLAELRAEFPDAAFFVSPEEVQGTLFYKIMAGLLPDTAAAAELRDRLLEAELIPADDGGGPFLVRRTPLSFALGEYATRPEAEAVADTLAARDVFVYPVAQPYSDGSQRWRLYAGGYRDSTAAAAMHQLAEEAGLRPELAQRVGLRPVAQK